MPRARGECGGQVAADRADVGFQGGHSPILAHALNRVSLLPMNVPMEETGTWFCPTERDRERLVDMSGGGKKARTSSAAALGTGLDASEPWVGWLPLALLALVGGTWRSSSAAWRRR